MNNVKEDLINKIIDELKRVNEDKEYRGERRLNIPFMIAPLSQSLEQFDSLINDLEEHTYYGVTYIEPEQENYYSNGTIEITLEKNDNELDKEEKYIKEHEEYSYFPTDYTYKINFEIDERDWKFCQCSEGDEDYDERYNCCGHGCDWSAPACSIEKVIEIGSKVWEGDEHDYWDFEDNFYNIDEKKKQEKQKQAKINRLKNQIEDLQKELDKLK